MPDEHPRMRDSPQVIEITVEYHSDGRGLARLGDRGRRVFATCAVAVIAVAAAIVIIGPLFGGTHRTTPGLPSPRALECDNGPTPNYFFGYRPPPTTVTPPTPAVCR